MLNQISKLSLFFVLAIAMIVTSCEKEGIDELTENFTTDTEQTVENARAKRGGQQGNRGGRGNNCFSTVFPVTIAFADGTTAMVDDKEAAKAAVQAWKEANPDAEERPSIAFPYDVQLRDSSVVTVDSEETLAALKETCSGDNGSRGGNRGDRGDRGNNCFQAVYPITIVLPDGASTMVEDKAAKRAAVQAWKEVNPDAEAKATIGFPLTVELADATQMTLNSQEELAALKETCSLEVEETGGN